MKTAAHIPLADQNARDHVEGRQRGWARAVKELETLFVLSPPPTPEPAQRYVTAEEAVAGLGLDDETKTMAAKEIRNLVSEQKTGFAVSKTLREQGLRQPVVKELLTRGMRMVAEMRATRAVADLFVRKAGPPPGAGWTAIPKGKKGGYRRPKSGGGWEYAYPDADGGYTSHDTPAADEGVSVHEEHEGDTPDPKVRERMTQLEAKAKAAGLGFSAKATSRTTMKHLNELEKQLDKAIAQKRTREKAEQDGTAPPKRKLTDEDVHATPAGGKPGKDGKGGGAEDGEPVTVAPKKDGDPGFAIPPRPGTEGDAPRAPAPTAPDAPAPAAEGGGDNAPAAPSAEPEKPPVAEATRKALHTLAEKKGIDPAKVDDLLHDPEAQTEDGIKAIQEHLEGLPDLPPPADLPDEPPEDPVARKKLEDHAKKLEETLAKMEKALAVERDAHAKEMAALRAEIKKFSERPSPRKAAETTQHLWLTALLIFGFVAGGIFAGPMGALLGASMAGNYYRTGIAKSGRRRLDAGVWLVKGQLVLVQKSDDGDDAHARTVRENDPARIVASRKAMLAELADAPATGSDDPRDIVAVLVEHSPTWKRVSPYLSPDNRRKLIVTATAVLQAKTPEAVLPPPPAEPPPAVAAPEEEPAAEAPPRIRGRHGENEHGHRDGLVPGQKLTVRKGAPGPELVEVLPDGVFRWGDNTYPNGRQLLKALTGREDHRLTVRRYFGLEAEDARLAKALSDALRARHPSLLVSPYQGRVRVEGALRKSGIPVDHPADTTVLLDLAAVQALLAPPESA